MRLPIRGLPLAVAVALVGCAASGSGGAGDAGPTSYKQSVGTAGLIDIQNKVPKILSRYQYEVERQDESPALLAIYTRWNGRYPLEDEIAQGVTEAMTRLILTARARARTGGTADVRVVELTAENRVRQRDSTEWRGLMTPMFKDYVDKLADELKTELLTGIRVY